jgi:PAS domain S-box-containing protein
VEHEGHHSENAPRAPESELVRSEPPALVLDDIQDYAIFLVSLDGRIASWNLGCERLKGYLPREAIGKPFAMLFTPEDRASGKPELEMQAALEHGVYHAEGVRMRKGGARFDAEVTLRLVKNATGKPKAFVKVTRDVTERRRLQKVERERVGFEKELLGIVSHDLRSPLQAILLGAATLLRHEGLDARQSATIARILSSAERATRLVRDLLDFTQVRLGSGLSMQRRRLDIHELVRQVVDEVAAGHPGCRVTTEAFGDGAVTWDSDRIAQLVSNLVSNAIKYGARDGVVRVTTRAEGEAIVLEVHNGGTPIPAEDLPSLFERLTQGARRIGHVGSIGLGLFIAFHVARAHGGTIEVESSTESGTTFRVRIDRDASPDGDARARA